MTPSWTIPLDLPGGRGQRRRAQRHGPGGGGARAGPPLAEEQLGVGGYRLLRSPASPRRNAAVALWLGNSAMIGGWTELFVVPSAMAPAAAVLAPVRRSRKNNSVQPPIIALLA
jgi:hypothetical protein